MFGVIKKKISITSLMFNVGFYSSYSMDNESTYGYLRLEDGSINHVDENHRFNDNPRSDVNLRSDVKSYNTGITNVRKRCSVKKKLLISGIASLGLIAIGTGLYFLLRDKNNNDDIVPPIPETNNFTDRITEIITNSISNVVATDAVIIPTDRIITTDTDLITNIPGHVSEDECVDLSDKCSNQAMMNFIKNKFNKANIERCYGILYKEGLNIIFNNDQNCQVSFYEKPSINILNGYNFNSLNVSGVMFENHQGLFDGIRANTMYFTNVNFKKVLNFSNFLINSNIANVYGLNNILIDKENDIENFIKNCQFTNLEIKNMTVNNKASISSIIKNSTINNTLDMSNYKTNNTHYDYILWNTKVNYINMKNINVRNSNLYIISWFNNIDLNNCSIYNSNLDDLFYTNTGNSVNMSYCNLTNVDFCYSFQFFNGYSVDISNTYFHLSQDIECQIFYSSNISYLNVSNSIFANMKDGGNMFNNGWFQTVNLTNTKADNLLYFDYGFYQSTFDNVIMHNFSTKLLSSCENMFLATRSNGNIRSIDISGWDMGNIRLMDRMFYFTNYDNVETIKHINASFININNQSQIESDDFIAPAYLTDLQYIWFDTNRFTRLRDFVIDSGFNCTGYGCYNPRFTLWNNKNSSILESNNTMAIKNKNNENLRNDKFNKFNNEDTLDNLKKKFNITVEDVDVTLNPETGRESIFLKLKLAINDYLINPFMKFFRLR